MNQSRTSTEDLAYILVREGNQWGRKILLNPLQITTVGRAPTNRLVLFDEICSRHHCEFFHSSSGWLIRDHDSRNGTHVNDELIERDLLLHEGDVIRVGHSQLLFTFFPDAKDRELDSPQLDSDTQTDIQSDSQTITPEILHRQRRSRYAESHSSTDSIPKENLSRLYQVALQMGAVTSISELADVVLKSIVVITNANIGAVLLDQKLSEVPRLDEVLSERYEIAANTQLSTGSENKVIVSQSLIDEVQEKGEAILAKDIVTDQSLSTSDSLDEIQARSAIVAPVQVDDLCYGMIHLYSTMSDSPLGRTDLDYTLAIAEQMATAISQLDQRNRLETGIHHVEQENQHLRSQLQFEYDLVGQSSVMANLQQHVLRVAPINTPVLVRGESGVGKELVARSIHNSSPRRKHPFVCMNCAALNESLLESELFGHEKGAFTGATAKKHGKFEQADQGTIFLDEVGEMSPAIQAKFLRVLEGHPFERIGGSETIQVDARVIAATNRNLEQAIKEKKFRKDLYFRLQVVEISIPSLNERMSDVPILAEYFLKKYELQMGKQGIQLDESALNKLMNYDWPGNVRELQNTIQRAMILSHGKEIQSQDIQLSTLSENDSSLFDDEQIHSIDEIEKMHIQRTLHQFDWNKSKCAQILGIERSTLDRKIKKYNIERN